MINSKYILRILMHSIKISSEKYMNLFPFLKERVICEKFALKIHKVRLSVCPKPIEFQH